MNSTPSGILVTGATGFIGRRLRQSGDRLLVRQLGVAENEVVGHLLDPTSLVEACVGISAVFHCAGYAHTFSSSDPGAHWRINFEGTRNLLKAAVTTGVRRFIFLSSVKAMAEPGDDCVGENLLGDPVTPYGKAKRAAEDDVLDVGAKYGMHVVNLRLAMVYGHGGRGNLERMARGIQAGWFPPLPDTGNRRSLVHVDDVVSAVRKVAERHEANGKTYIVADAHAYSGRKIYNVIRAALNQSPAHWQIPAGLLQAGGKLGDVLGSLMRCSFPVNSEIVERLLGSACYSPGLIERELGWGAAIGLTEGVREMLGISSENTASNGGASI